MRMNTQLAVLAVSLAWLTLADVSAQTEARPDKAKVVTDTSQIRQQSTIAVPPAPAPQQEAIAAPRPIPQQEVVARPPQPEAVAQPVPRQEVVAQPPAQPQMTAPAAVVPRMQVEQRVTDLVRSGNIAQSQQVVEEYRAGAASKEDAAKVTLTLGDELVRMAPKDPAMRAAAYRAAEEQYAYAIRAGDAPQQVLASNNLAAARLAQGDVNAAVATMDDGFAAAKSLPDPGMRAQYLYNYGKILERSGSERSVEAYAQYRQAALDAPRRADPAAAGVSLALKRGEPAQAAGFLDLLVRHGHLDSATRGVRDAMDEGDLLARDDRGDVAAVLFDLIPAQNTSSADFATSWQPYLAERGSTAAPASATMLRLVSLGYADTNEIPRVQRSREAIAALNAQALSADQRKAAARYFTQVGAQRAAEGDDEAAYALYTLAGGLDESNIDAALYRANLLLAHRETLDPDGQRLNRFVDELFLGKGEAYLGDDWQAILRFHTVLGTIFWQQRKWGDPRDPRGAIFQLEHAVQARKMLGEGENVPRIPGVYELLAQCYSAVRRPAEAYDAQLDAARDALAQQDAPRAGALLEKGDVLSAGYAPSAAQLERKAKLAKALQES
jgi:hypothetical protein